MLGKVRVWDTDPSSPWEGREAGQACVSVKHCCLCAGSESRLGRWLSWPSAYLVNVKTLPSLSRTHVKNLGVMKHTYDSSSGKAETGGFLGLGGSVRNLVSGATEEHG